jgi:putative ferrous iron transport protein C
MILSDLKGYLEQRRQATLADMALHLRAEPEAVREMLAVWEHKGRVRRLPAPAGCGRTCAGCGPGASEVYLWVEPGEPVSTLPTAPGCGR